jgi:hypothetical protein
VEVATGETLTLKTLTLTQPWATLVAIGAKRIETRSWGTSYRGPLAIHAAKTFPGWAKDQVQSDPMFRRALGLPDPPHPLTQEWLDSMRDGIEALPLGCVLVVCRLVDCKVIVETETEQLLMPGARMLQPPQPERTFGDYNPGRYAWILDNVSQQFDPPIPAKGHLGLWDWEMPCERPY